MRIVGLGPQPRRLGSHASTRVVHDRAVRALKRVAWSGAWFLIVAGAAVVFAQGVKPTPTSKDGGLSRPPVDDRVQLLGRTLFEAVVRDDPRLAEQCFFPREPFLQVKAIPDPGRYWDRLHARFARDVHALHAGTPGIAGLAQRGGLVKPGEEGNRLAYWASRHSWLHFRVGAQAKRFEVRVLISWQDRWYVIHLSEFK